MKNILPTLLLGFLFAISFPNKVFSVNNNLLITELSVFDSVTTYRYTYLYKNQGNKVLETKYYQKDNVWVRILQSEWLYQGNQCVALRERIFKNNEWFIAYTIDYEYINGFKVSEMHSTYTNAIINPFRKISYLYSLSVLTSKSEYYWNNGNWTLSQINDYTYGTNGKLESDSSLVYQSGSISNQLLSTYSYNPEGNLVSQLLRQKEGSNSWGNLEFINWYYKPGTSLVLAQRNKKWILDTSTWENTQNMEYHYNVSNLLESETCQRWKTMFWDNDIRYDYIYDNQGQQVKKILSLPIYHKWRGIISINYLDFTGSKPNLMESKFEFWGGNAAELTTSYIPFIFNNEMVIQKGKRILISYLPDTITSADIYINSKNLVQVYPNPSNGIYYIDSQKYNVSSWTISDLKGRILKKQFQPIFTGVIDITNLPIGIYILKVITPDTQLTQKLLKE